MYCRTVLHKGNRIEDGFYLQLSGHTHGCDPLLPTMGDIMPLQKLLTEYSNLLEKHPFTFIQNLEEIDTSDDNMIRLAKTVE